MFTAPRFRQIFAKARQIFGDILRLNRFAKSSVQNRLSINLVS